MIRSAVTSLLYALGEALLYREVTALYGETRHVRAIALDHYGVPSRISIDEPCDA